MASGLPGWRALLKQMLAYADDEGVRLPHRADVAREIENGDLLNVGDELRERLGEGRFQEILTELLGNRRAIPSEVHKELWNLPFASIITTNYDTLLESAYSGRKGDLPLTFTPGDYSAVPISRRSGEPHLFKLHGSLNNPGSIVFGRADYRRLNLRTGRLYAYLMSVFSQNTVLFLGYSLTDPDLTVLLENMQEAYDKSTPTCYALVSNDAVSEFNGARLATNYNLQLIRYEPSDPSHPEVLDFLRGLSRAVRDRGVDSSETKDSAPCEELAREVEDWLESIGFAVRPPEQVNGRTLRMLAVLDAGPYDQTVRVYCVDGEISVEDVLLARREADLNANKAWIFADSRISPGAREEAGQTGLIHLYTLSEFLEKKVWAPYIEAITRKAEEDRLDALYVDVGCSRNSNFPGPDRRNGNGTIPAWTAMSIPRLGERGRVHLSLLWPAWRREDLVLPPLCPQIVETVF